MRRERWRSWPWLVAFVALAFLYTTVARHIYGGDSDGATLILQGQAISQGHVTLHGWWFLLDPLWTVDVPMYTLGYQLVGLRPELWFLVPGVFAALVVLVAVHIAGRGQSRRGAWIAAGLVIALIGLPSNWWALLFMRSGWHVATTLYCLIAFACLSRSGDRWRWRWLVGVALLALGQVGDLQTLVLGTVPIGVAGLVAMARRRNWRAGIAQVSAAVVAPLAGLAIRGLALLVGTYNVGVANPHASSAQIVENVKRLPAWLGLAFGSASRSRDTLGGPVLLAALRSVAAVVVVAAVLVALVLLLRDAVRGTNRVTTAAAIENAAPTGAAAAIGAAAPIGNAQESWQLEDMLALGCAADLVFFAYATLADDHSYLRYLTPFVIMGATLAARTIARQAAATTWTTAPRRALAGGAALLTILWAGSFVHDLTRTEPPLADSDLVAALQAHHLHLGLGYYWVANSSTVTSGGKVIIRPVQANHAQHIVRRDQLSSDIWYGKAFQFLVINRPAPFENVTLGTATRTFGTPDGTFNVGPFEVLTWNHPISVAP